MNFDMKAQPFFGSDTSCEGRNLILLSLFASQDLKCRLVYVIDAWVWFAYTMSWLVLPPLEENSAKTDFLFTCFPHLSSLDGWITYWLYFPKFLNNIIFFYCSILKPLSGSSFCLTHLFSTSLLLTSWDRYQNIKYSFGVETGDHNLMGVGRSELLLSPDPVTNSMNVSLILSQFLHL